MFYEATLVSDPAVEIYDLKKLSKILQNLLTTITKCSKSHNVRLFVSTHNSHVFKE